ncbi:MAG: TonB-dependent receptor [Alphaproteobacteria bacterium]|nr:TonB-dependent receptor [Alphaproteobacteria bacterium]
MTNASNKQGFKTRSKLFASTLAITAVMAAAPVQAQAAATSDLVIEAQSMETALNQLAQNYDKQIVVYSADAKGMTAQKLEGAYTEKEALDTILKDSGLVFKYVNDRTIAVGSPERLAANYKSDQGVSSFRVAQLATQEDRAVESVPDAQGDFAGGQKRDEVIVTGSRIRRSPFSSPTPTTIIDSTTIEQSGLTQLSDIITRLPSISPGTGLSTSTGGTFQSGASFLDLRGLGSNRTLTLIDGRRRVPGSRFSAAVDISSIPPSMVETVEVITGGASAVYGADAVTGVVNIILKKDFEGLEFNAEGGWPGQGGGADTKWLSLHAGLNFDDDRGNISIGGSYSKQNILMGNQRRFGQQAQGFFANPDNTGPNDGISNLRRFDNFVFSGFATTGTFYVDGTEYTVNPNLQAKTYGDGPFAPGFFVATAGDDRDIDFDLAKYDQLRSGLDTYTGIAKLTYEVNDHINFNLSGEYGRTESEDRFQPLFDSGLTIFRENPLLPTDVTVLMDNSYYYYNYIYVYRTHEDLGVRPTFNNRDTFTIAGGFDGELGNDWLWDAFYQYGRNDFSSRTEGQTIQANFLQAVDVISGPGGAPVCRDVAARAAGCLPFNLLGPSMNSQASKDYFQYTSRTEVRTTQSVAGASANGPLFSVPAGDVKMAAGFEYRKESLRLVDDELARSGQLSLTAGSQDVEADFNVWEVYGEVLAPVLADKPFVKSFEVGAAVRYSDYNTTGASTAWKVTANWELDSNIRLRGSRDHSIRAPNLIELFDPGTASFVFINDPCSAAFINLGSSTRATNCAALGLPAGFVDPFSGSSKQTLSGGNPDLSPETANTWTVGGVFTPEFMSGFSLAVDYWTTGIDEAVESIAITDIVDRCVDADNIANSFCGLITRRADGAIIEVQNSPINVGNLRASGIDITTQYSVPAPGLFADEAGELNLQISATRRLKSQELVDAGDPSTLIIFANELGSSYWEGTMSASYSSGPVNFNWFSYYVGSAVLDRQAVTERFPIGLDRVGAKLYNDLYIGWQIEERATIYGGINNVFNVEPPNNPNTYLGGFGVYDNVGRFFYAGIRLKL